MKLNFLYFILLTFLISLNACKCKEWSHHTMTETAKKWQIPYKMGKIFTYKDSTGSRIDMKIFNYVNDFDAIPSYNKRKNWMGCEGGYFDEFVEYSLAITIDGKLKDSLYIHFSENGFIIRPLSSGLGTAFIDLEESKFIDGQQPYYYYPGSTIYIKELFLGGRFYQNVYKDTVKDAKNGFTCIYYQKTYGIIGFETTDGKLFYLI